MAVCFQPYWPTSFKKPKIDWSRPKPKKVGPTHFTIRKAKKLRDGWKLREIVKKLQILICNNFGIRSFPQLISFPVYHLNLNLNYLHNENFCFLYKWWAFEFPFSQKNFQCSDLSLSNVKKLPKIDFFLNIFYLNRILFGV